MLKIQKVEIPLCRNPSRERYKLQTMKRTDSCYNTLIFIVLWVLPIEVFIFPNVAGGKLVRK